MAKRKIHLDEKTELLIELYNTGKTLRELSSVVGMHYNSIKYRLSQMGVKLRPRMGIPDQIPWNLGKEHSYRGNIHWNWKGGITKETRRNNMKIRKRGRNRWRKAVLERDSYKCQMPDCEKTPNQFLDVNHITLFKDCKDDIKLLTDVNNGITLCRKCHLKIRGKEKDFKNLFITIVTKKPRI